MDRNNKSTPKEIVVIRKLYKHMSSGAKMIYQYLLQDRKIYNIKLEYKLVGSNKRYDFYYQYNNKEYIIEFDGGQHFEDVKFFRTTAFEQHDNDMQKYYDMKKAKPNIIYAHISHTDINNNDDVALHMQNILSIPHELYCSNRKDFTWVQRTYNKIAYKNEMMNTVDDGIHDMRYYINRINNMLNDDVLSRYEITIHYP